MKFFTSSHFRAIVVLILFIALCGNCFNSFSTAWTTSTAGPVNTLSNWTNGTGSPTTFLTPGDTWTVTMAMTLPSGAIWTLGAATSAPDTLTLATGGTISVGGIPATPVINVYGVFMINGGTLSMGGTAASEVINVYGDAFMLAGTITTPASSAHLYINTYGTFTMSGGTANSTGSGASITYNINGNLVMTGGTIGTSAAGADDTVNVHGNFNMTGGTLQAGGASCNFLTNIYGDCSISGTGAMTNTGAGCTNNAHLMLPAASGTMMIHNTSTGTWSGTNVYVDAGCTAELDGNFSTTTGSSAFGVTVNGTLICPAAHAMNGTRMFTLNSGATLKVAHATGINGAITTTGTRTFSTGANYEYNGSVAQVTGTYLPASLVAPDTITINNSAGVTLSQGTLTTGKLVFISGILTTGSFTMSVPGAAASVAGAGATSYVNGTLVKTISGVTSINYEVGDANYAPMALTLSSAGTAGSLGVKCSNGLHPSVGSSGLSTSFMANHYWTITNTGAAGPATVIPTATYNAIDIIGGSNSGFVTQKYSGSAWLGSPLATTNTSTPYTSAPNTGITLGTLAGEYIFGDVFCGTAPVVGPSAVCAGSTIALTDATPGGTWVSGSTTIATVSGSGVVTGVAGGVVTISYTAGTCLVTKIVTVNPMPNAGSITGPVSVCEGDTIILIDAAPGGTWSSSNPSLATVTGSGVVSGIAAGSVTITYTVINVCGTATATKPVTVISLATCALGSGPVVNTPIKPGIRIYPNPNKGMFTLSITSVENDEISVVITNILGETVKTFQTAANKTTDVTMTVKGVYFLSASGANEKYNAKFIVE